MYNSESNSHRKTIDRKNTKISAVSEARFKRRILHVPNLMQMNENNRFFSDLQPFYW